MYISLLTYLKSQSIKYSNDLTKEVMPAVCSKWCFTNKSSNVCIIACAKELPDLLFYGVKSTNAFKQRKVFYYELLKPIEIKHNYEYWEFKSTPKSINKLCDTLPKSIL